MTKAPYSSPRDLASHIMDLAGPEGLTEDGDCWAVAQAMAAGLWRYGYTEADLDADLDERGPWDRATDYAEAE